MSDPVQLLFALEEPDPDATPAVASLIRELNDDRNWSRGVIKFVNEMDETPTTQPDDEPTWTLGGVLTLTRPSDDLGSDRSQFRDVEFLLDRLCQFSAGGRAIVIEYDGEEIGTIEDGNASTSVRDGLLGEWRKRLQGP